MPSLPDTVRALITDTVGVVYSAVPIRGGDTSRAARVQTSSGHVFVKWGASPAGDSYAAEAEGLAALAAAEPFGFDRPEPLAMRAPGADGPGALVLTWLEAGDRFRADWWAFGMNLSELHGAEVPSTGYGWHADNWIGSKPQRNGWWDDWADFFGQRRLLAQAEAVRDYGNWDAAWDAPLGRLITRLPEILPRTPRRSLLHGDLWFGNVMPLRGGRFALIDPAVYVGDAEVDLAMMELFGGFGDALAGYDNERPLAPGYEDRFEVYNLYHLINHLTHGPQYRDPVEATLHRFGA